MRFKFLGGKYFNGDPLRFLAEIVVRGRVMQMYSNFPPKTLRRNFIIRIYKITSFESFKTKSVQSHILKAKCNV